MIWICATLAIMAVLLSGFWVIERWDVKLPVTAGGRGVLVLLCIILGRFAAGTGVNWLCISVILGCLLIACTTDKLFFTVHNFIWWIGGAAAGWMVGREWICRYRDWEFYERLLSLLIFILLQLLVFSKMYGKADCYAFCVCALAEMGLGMQIYEFLMHMLIAYFILFIVQFARKNLAKSGDLKVSVAFIPYITASFLIFLHKYAI